MLIILLIKALNIYLWLIIASVLISWLIAFDVLNLRNKYVYKVCNVLNKLVEPPMAKVRKIIPPVGGIDFTPMVIIFGIYLIQSFLLSLPR
jgi:YggT family protein